MLSNRFFMDIGKVWAFAIPLLLFLSACNRTETKGNEEKLEATAQSIQRTFVNVSCVSCHTQNTTANRNVVLTDITRIIEEPGQPHEHGKMRMLIKPGCPKESFFLSIMKEGKMPPKPSEKVSADTVKVIEDWIISLKPNAGKYCNSDEPPDKPGGGDEPGGGRDTETN